MISGKKCNFRKTLVKIIRIPHTFIIAPFLQFESSVESETPPSLEDTGQNSKVYRDKVLERDKQNRIFFLCSLVRLTTVVQK